MAALLASSGAARADDYVIVRGAYYREASTRVVQPMVEVDRDSPTGIDVSAHYLVDAITSASASAGVGVDSLFTEIRNEAGLRLAKRWELAEVRLGYRYSAESDYWSHAVAGSVAGKFWGDTARVALSLGLSFDSVSARGRTPACAAAGSFSCSLDGYYAGVSYTQVLSPVLIAQASLEAMLLDGFQGNVYRTVPNLGYEVLPTQRLRSAASVHVAYYLPNSETGFQVHYRYYRDPWPATWNMNAHTIDLRLFQMLTPDLEVRLSYRRFIGDGASFWCDTVADSACYFGKSVYSTDPKLGPGHTDFPEVKFYWQASAFAEVPLLRWFATGTFEASYGRYLQSTSFGPAHVLQAGYRMPY